MPSQINKIAGKQLGFQQLEAPKNSIVPPPFLPNPGCACNIANDKRNASVQRPQPTHFATTIKHAELPLAMLLY